MRDGLETLGIVILVIFLILCVVATIIGIAEGVTARYDGYGLAYNRHESLAAGRVMTYIGQENYGGGSWYCFVTEVPWDEDARLRMGCVPTTDVLNLEGAAVSALNVEPWTPTFGQEVMLTAANVGERSGFLITPTIVEVSVTIPTTTG